MRDKSDTFPEEKMSEQIKDVVGQVLTLYKVRYLAETEEDKCKAYTTFISVKGDTAFGVSDALHKFMLIDPIVQNDRNETVAIIKNVVRIESIERQGSVYVEMHND